LHKRLHPTPGRRRNRPWLADTSGRRRSVTPRGPSPVRRAVARRLPRRAARRKL